MFYSNRISQLFGRFASHQFCTPIQHFINRVYVKIFKIDLEEFAPISSYSSLNALFTRSLQKPRAIDSNPHTLIAPTDSLITQMGKTEQKTALQIKGMSYSIEDLLGQKLDKDLYYINFYLSPKDYHRFHAPCDMEIEEVRYFGGELLAVNMPSLNKNHDLFVRNERVVIVAKTPQNQWLYFVAIGALNVGSIILHFDSKIHTNAGMQSITYDYRTPVIIRKGEELGMFQMGSTVVLAMEQAEINIQIGDKVRYAQNIGTYS